jgi:hypothetical protein
MMWDEPLSAVLSLPAAVVFRNRRQEMPLEKDRPIEYIYLP